MRGVRSRLTVWRRKRCIRLQHQGQWIPVFTWREPDTMGPDGTIIDGKTIEQCRFECDRHDR